MTMVKLIIKLTTWGGSQSVRNKLIGWARLACVDAPATQMLSANHNSGPNLSRSLTFNTMTKTVFAIVANIWINLFRWWKANMYLWDLSLIVVTTMIDHSVLSTWLAPALGNVSHMREGKTRRESKLWVCKFVCYSLLVYNSANWYIILSWSKVCKLEEERWQATLYPYPSVSENNKVNCKTNFETSPSCHTS